MEMPNHFTVSSQWTIVVDWKYGTPGSDVEVSVNYLLLEISITSGNMVHIRILLQSYITFTKTNVPVTITFEKRKIWQWLLDDY